LRGGFWLKLAGFPGSWTSSYCHREDTTPFNKIQRNSAVFDTIQQISTYSTVFDSLQQKAAQKMAANSQNRSLER
jgi:hypothetical protein